MNKSERVDLRASVADREILSRLAAHLGITPSATVWQAVRKMAREEGVTMTTGWTLYLTQRRLAEARAALRDSNDVDAREEGLAHLRKAKPGYLINLIPDSNPDALRARQIVATALTTER